MAAGGLPAFLPVAEIINTLMKSEDKESEGPESISVCLCSETIWSRIWYTWTLFELLAHCLFVFVCVCVSVFVCEYECVCVFSSKSQGSGWWEGWGLEEWTGVDEGSWWLLGVKCKSYFQYCIASCHNTHIDTHREHDMLIVKHCIQYITAPQC